MPQHDPASADLSRVVDRRSLRKVPGRRRSLRFYLDRDVRIRFSHNGHEVSCYAEARDVSETGLGIVCTAPLRLGQRVHVQLSFTASTQLDLEAVVYRHARTSYGLEFLTATATVRHLLRTHLHACAGEPPRQPALPPWL